MERTFAPDASNPYFYSGENPFYSSNQIEKCTLYAFGRAYEILAMLPKFCKLDVNRWYDSNKDYGDYSFSSDPKVGAIACVNAPDGVHLAVVAR